jgi:hypothetical protein
MPKMSVSIPDDLWDKAKALSSTGGGSQLVQEALSEMVGRRGRRPYAELDEELQRDRRLAQHEIDKQLRKAYGIGYSVGLRIARQMPWDALYLFAELGWDLDRFRSEASHYEFMRQAVESESIDPDYPVFDFDLSFTDAMRNRAELVIEEPEGVLREGLIDAFRDLWEGAGGPGQIEPPDRTPAAPAGGLRVVKEPSGDVDDARPKTIRDDDA